MLYTKHEYDRDMILNICLGFYELQNIHFFINFSINLSSFIDRNVNLK